MSCQKIDYNLNRIDLPYDPCHDKNPERRGAPFAEALPNCSRSSAPDALPAWATLRGQTGPE